MNKRQTMPHLRYKEFVPEAENQPRPERGAKVLVEGLECSMPKVWLWSWRLEGKPNTEVDPGTGCTEKGGNKRRRDPPCSAANATS
jgi:hypothetical protein